jgi:hypothetical protein
MEKEVALHMNNFESPSRKDDLSQLGYNWFCSSGEVENVKV